MRLLIAPLTMTGLFACAPAPNSGSIPALPHHVPNANATDSLTSTIALLDSSLFAAFNAHDAAALGSWFSSDLEFYHDKGGLAGYDSTMAGFRRMFTQTTTADMHRELVPGTLEVYPLGDFGALEICEHRFCHTENGKQECGTFRNIMVWRRDSTGHRVSRVISFDH